MNFFSDTNYYPVYIHLAVCLRCPPVSVHTQDVYNRLPTREECEKTDYEQRHLQENTDQFKYQLFRKKSRYTTHQLTLKSFKILIKALHVQCT